MTAALLLSSLACAAGKTDDAFGDGGSTDASSDASSEDAPTPGGSSSSSSSSTGDEASDSHEPEPPDPPRLDVAAPEQGCQAVDLLFVVDDSGSMRDEQEALIESFPAFAAAMQAELETVQSYHVGVVTSDAYGFNAEGCRDLGALVTETQAGTCGPFAEGQRFMTEADPLAETFACAASVGTQGDVAERQVGALLAALDDGVACNEGFRREDALLVVTFLTDESDNETPGTPAQWYAELVARLGGDETRAVLVSIVTLDTSTCLAPDWSFDIIELTESFTHGAVGDICDDDYAEFFAEAVDVIDTACNDFAPAG